ncbi:hypothetical protein U1Q18_050919 [Sarracenia purpurea var. burkii]
MNKLHYNMEKVPQRYVPYTEFALPMLNCIYDLDDVKESIKNIQRFEESNHFSTMPDIFTLDPVISPLFSSYVFSDNNPPIRLIRRLAKILRRQTSTLSSRVEKLLKHRYFPRRYSWYAKCLLEFLKSEYRHSLKCNLYEVQHVITSLIPQEEQDSENGSIVPTLPNNDLDAELSRNIFIKDVRNLLSPEIFSQSDPYGYFFAKALELPKHILRETDSWLTYFLDNDSYPPRYMPYAELASSLLSCLVPLSNMEQILGDIQRSDPYSRNQRTLISTLHPELSKLFTDDIFSQADPIPRILNKLLDIPDNEISNMAIRLQTLLDKDQFPTRYVGYAGCLLNLLQNEYLLLRLKDNIAEMQRTLRSNSLASVQPNSIIAQE